MASLLARKIGMTQFFGEDGKVVPVTVLKAGPCYVTQKKTPDKEGYAAIQIGFEDKKPSRVTQPMEGHFKTSGVPPKRHLREIRIPASELDGYELGQELGADLFKEGDRVDLVGTSKGRGFTGVMKRYGFHGMKASHGTHEFFRHGGAIGQHSYPGEVKKGQKMPGHYGNARVTVKNLTVAKTIPEKNILMIRGGAPGHRNGLVLVQTAKTGGN
jgi:large subunit ribosomal protein L3